MSLPIIGLTMLAGYYLNKDGKVPRNEEKRNTVEETEKPNGYNIYNSNKVNEVNQEVLDKSLENYKKAENPSLTGVLPPLYNTYSSIGKIPVGSSESGALSQLQIANNAIRYSDPKAKSAGDINIRPMFTSDLSYREVEPMGANMTEDSEVSLLTGRPIERNHSNMVPFFGSTLKQNIETFSNESILDRHTGLTSVFEHKKEVPNMFESQPQNIYGAPLFTNVIDTERYIPSVYKQNEKAVEDVKVSAPIAGTFQNQIRPSYKDVNNLRVASKPKETYKGKIIAGKRGEVRGIQNDVNKNRPDTYYEKTKDDWFVTTGDIIAPKAPEDFITNFKDTSRQDYNAEYIGGAKGDTIKESQRMRHIDNSDELDASIFQDPKRKNYENDYLRNVGNITAAKDYGKDAMNAYETERTTTGVKSHLLNATRQEFGIKTRLLDAPKETIKQTTLSFDNSGNIKTVYGRGKGDAYNNGITDISFKPTHKETTIVNNYKGNATKMEGMGYVVNKYTPRETHKEETIVRDRAAGPQNFQVSSGKDSYGDITFTENMGLREGTDNRQKTLLRSQIIPSKDIVGKINRVRYDDDIEDTVTNDRLQPDLVQLQHNQNPYSIYNQKRQ